MRKSLPLVKVIRLAYTIPIAVLLMVFIVLAVYFAYNEASMKSHLQVRTQAVTTSIVAGYPVITNDPESLKAELSRYLSIPKGEVVKITTQSGAPFYNAGSLNIEPSLAFVSRITELLGGESTVSAVEPIYMRRIDPGTSNNFSEIQKAGDGLRVGTVTVKTNIAASIIDALIPRIVAVGVLLLCSLLSFVYIQSIGRKVAYALGLLAEKNDRLRDREYDSASVKENYPAIQEIDLLIQHHNYVVSELKMYDMGMQDSVRKQTAYIQNQNRILEDTSAKLLSINEGKTQFMKAVSHDLRNPLGSIKLSSEMLMKMVENRDAVVLAQQIMTSARNMTSIIEDIMDVNQMEDDWVSVNRTEVDVVSLIDQAVNQYQQSADQKGIDLFWMPSRELNASMMADERLITRIVSNLVGNSVRNTSHGYVNLYARTEEDDDEQGYLVIEVTDSGSELTEKDVDSMFKGDEELAAIDFSQGIGLGLSIVKQMVSALGGEIRVICKEGLGTSFIVSIPVDLIARYSRTQSEIRQQFSNLELKVAVFDDNTPFAQAMASFLWIHNVPVRVVNHRPLSLESKGLENIDVLIGHKLSVIPALVSTIKGCGIEVISMESLHSSEQMETLKKTVKIDHPVMLHSSFFSIIRLLTSIEQQRSVTRIGAPPNLMERMSVSPLGDILSAKMRGPLDGKTILVIDGSQEFGRALKALIESNDGVCILKHSVSSMPDKETLEQVDLVLIDYEVSGGRATQCVKEIRDNFGESSPKMICVTSHVVVSSSPEFIAMERLVDMIVSKPLPSSDEIIGIFLNLIG